MLRKYRNGNAIVTLDNDGSRVIEYEDTLKLDYPLNIDIRVSTQCSFGQRPDGTHVLCNFCHESAKTDGKECDYSLLKDRISDLPKGIELAIGCNKLTPGLYEFITWCDKEGYIVNLTINQGHIRRDAEGLRLLTQIGFIKGLGVSYRSELPWEVPSGVLEYPNTVFHVIVGIDKFEDVEKLADLGVKKILVLGEKNFGFNEGKVDLTTQCHKEWFWWIHKLFSKFQVVSFDNLALQQLRIQRFFTNENWNTFNQGEHSFYINAVEGYYSPSSRSKDKTDWTKINILKYFKTLEKDGL